MKLNQKPYITKKKVINRGKRSKKLSQVKPGENLNKKESVQFSRDYISCKRKSFLNINCKAMYLSQRNLLD